MKNHIGKLLMLATVSFVFVGVSEVSAMKGFSFHKSDAIKQKFANTKKISYKDLTPEVNDFINNNVHFPAGGINMTVGKSTGILKFSDLEQARADHVNGIEVFDGLGVGDSVSIGVAIFDIVE